MLYLFPMRNRVCASRFVEVFYEFMEQQQKKPTNKVISKTKLFPSILQWSHAIVYYGSFDLPFFAIVSVPVFVCWFCPCNAHIISMQRRVDVLINLKFTTVTNDL